MWSDYHHGYNNVTNKNSRTVYNISWAPGEGGIKCRRSPPLERKAITLYLGLK